MARGVENVAPYKYVYSKREAARCGGNKKALLVGELPRERVRGLVNHPLRRFHRHLSQRARLLERKHREKPRGAAKTYGRSKPLPYQLEGSRGEAVCEVETKRLSRKESSRESG